MMRSIFTMGALLLVLAAACAPASNDTLPPGPDGIPDTGRIAALECPADAQGLDCADVYEPVCVDGQTYGNACEACRQQGVERYFPRSCDDLDDTGGPSGDGTGTQTPTEPPADEMQFTSCTDPRPEICTMEYNPVCAAVDNGVRCITEPCDSTDWRTYSTGCTACADPLVYGYRPGECTGTEEAQDPKGPGNEGADPRYMLCMRDGMDRRDFARQYGFTCVDACPAGYDEFAAQMGRMCVRHYGTEEFSQWPECSRSTECASEQACAMPTLTTDGQEVRYDGMDAGRCVPQDYADFLINTAGLTSFDENGERSTVIA